jgi:hypothetical protein
MPGSRKLPLRINYLRENDHPNSGGGSRLRRSAAPPRGTPSHHCPEPLAVESFRATFDHGVIFSGSGGSVFVVEQDECGGGDLADVPRTAAPAVAIRPASWDVAGSKTAPGRTSPDLIDVVESRRPILRDGGSHGVRRRGGRTITTAVAPRYGAAGGPLGFPAPACRSTAPGTAAPPPAVGEAPF